LPNPSQMRATSLADRKARIRPGAAAAAFGALAGLAIGGAYLAGTAAKANTIRTQALRIEGAAAAGFTEEALAAAAGGLDESALAIARRHDPYLVAGAAQRDRQAELLAARLDELRASDASSGLRRANLTSPTAAQPFRLGGALEASRDLDCLTQAVYYEARGEGRDGMKAVAQVVLNRARHPAFPKSVCGVVFQGANRSTGCQFSFTCNGAMRGRVNTAAWNRARTIATSALSGEVFGAVGNATHFHTTGVSPQWRNSLVRVSQVGDHLFYRFGGRSGSSAAFSYAAQRSTPADTAPRLIQADLDTTRGPVAYEQVVSRETGAAPAPAPTTTPTATRPTTAPAAAPASEARRAPAPIAAPSTAASSISAMDTASAGATPTV